MIVEQGPSDSKLNKAAAWSNVVMLGIALVTLMVGSCHHRAEEPAFRVFLDGAAAPFADHVLLVGKNCEVFDPDARGIVRIPGHFAGARVSVRNKKTNREIKSFILGDHHIDIAALK